MLRNPCAGTGVDCRPRRPRCTYCFAAAGTRQDFQNARIDYDQSVFFIDANEASRLHAACHTTAEKPASPRVAFDGYQGAARKPGIDFLHRPERS
ncbi:hypothetical protein [Pseudoxanthomonas mexicana]|uniref:hypothetical protein n=1 Tax=Pseudoxanthomonas mexicana TaxID=128785 RepID=UPI00398B061C